MAGMGTGYPLTFDCSVYKRTRDWRAHHDAVRDGHVVVLTGRTRRTGGTKGHPRKLPTTYQYRCQCGHVGWSSHWHLLGYPLEQGAEMGQEYPTRWETRTWHGRRL